MQRTVCWAMLGAMILAGSMAPPARAQQGSPSSKFTSFLCQIDLGENNLSQFLTNPNLYPDGIVSTFSSEKLCTGSATDQNVNITCTAQLAGWQGGNRLVQNVPCSIGGAACGIPGVVAAANSKLQISGGGLATLSCQFKGP